VLSSIFKGETTVMNARMTEQQKIIRQRGASQRDHSRSSEPPENEIIQSAQRGNASAFERIYRLHSARVYAVCFRMVGNAAEAEDLTQEAFLLVMRKIRTFRGESAFSTWLHRLAVNLVLMRFRKKTLPETSLDESGEPGSDRRAPRKELARPDLQLAGSLDRLTIERALAQLRPMQKMVVILHDVQGYKHVEIAKMMGWSPGNSKSQLHRARARLRKLLQERFRFPRLTPVQTAQPAFTA
jgi:RNA polymerase sigma-70 factor (ECF subfamily)